MIYIILPVHNRKDITELFIQSLSKQTYKEFRLILVDDGSTDGTDKMVINYLPSTIVVKGDGNLWWAGGLQKGYKWLLENARQDDLCLLINDDTIFDSKFLELGVSLLLRESGALILAQCFSQRDKRLIDAGVFFDYKKLTFKQAESASEINCLSTRGLFFKWEDFKVIGGFFPSILPHYLSDYEFTIRANRKGFNLITSNELKLYVNEETTGIHSIDSLSVLDYWKKYFSKRNTSNPFHWFFFIILAVPFPYKIYHLVRHSCSTFKQILKPLIK